MEIRPFEEGDFPGVARLNGEAFRVQTALDLEPWLEGGWVLADGNRVIASARVDHTAMFFGGRAVPTAALSSMVVAPQFRGRGLATQLLGECLRAGRDSGEFLSVLYPLTIPVYRAVGYELAGSIVRLRTDIRALPARSQTEAEEWDDSSLGVVADCYQRSARRSNGLIDRDEKWWHRRVLHAADSPLYRYLIRRDDEVVAYAVYTQVQEPAAAIRRGPTGELGYHYSVSCRDLVWNDAESAVALLAFLSGHRSLGLDLIWSGPFDEPLMWLLADHETRIQYSMMWMLRLVDIARALQFRGYPFAIEAVAEFQVRDDTLVGQSGAYRLEVSGGQAAVDRVQRAQMSIDVASLAAIYSGWLTPRDAVLTGKLTGAHEAGIHALEAIFAGNKPWMVERF